jgi:hypothetical protein
MLAGQCARDINLVVKDGAVMSLGGAIEFSGAWGRLATGAGAGRSCDGRTVRDAAPATIPGSAFRLPRRRNHPLCPTGKGGTYKPYTVLGQTYHPSGQSAEGYSETGVASWYGPNFSRQEDGQRGNATTCTR